MEHVAFSGRGLHGGAPCAIRLLRRPGPLLFAHGVGTAPLPELDVVRADQGVRVRAPRIGLDVDLVEHLCAALAGVGVRSDLTISIVGGEVPLLDGGARELATALIALELPRQAPRLRVMRSGEITIDESSYRFEPGPAPLLEVEVDFPGVGVERSSWDDDVGHFVHHIAPARTFGYAADAERLRAAGRARWVDPASVLVLDAEGRATPPSAPRQPGELARHKLLDLMGDLYLHGGPPQGLVAAQRPGHARTHAAVRKALDQGLLGPL